MIIYGTKITLALCAQYTISKFNTMYRSTEYLLSQSLYRISCPLIAKGPNTLTTFVVNVRQLFPSFSQPQHIDLERCAALSDTPALLKQLFIYRVASNAAISSELPHARSLTHGRIPELFKRLLPTCQKFSLGGVGMTTNFICAVPALWHQV